VYHYGTPNDPIDAKQLQVNALKDRRDAAIILGVHITELYKSKGLIKSHKIENHFQ